MIDKKYLPKYPIYIISKGRADSRLTVKALECMDIDYRIVIEPQEYDNYVAYINPQKILTLPFSNLGQGSIPARNWVWQYSKNMGAKRHWILDDNIAKFERTNFNMRIKVKSPVVFRIIEDFVDRYTNILMAGMNYHYFVPSYVIKPAIQFNTRIYSCILLSNNCDYQWRGKYNEDTDLSLRILKDGYCTALFNSIICDKKTTLTMKGGNTDNVYIDGDNRYKFAESLQKQHPDVTKIVWRYNRWHHEVDYRKFEKNKLIKKEGLQLEDKIDNYNMVLIKRRINK